MTAIRRWLAPASKRLKERFRRPGRDPIFRPDSEPVGPKLIFEWLGAAAGVTALMTLAGGALVWLRFDELGLPADRIVTLLPRELFVTVGAHALIAAALAGVVAVVVIYVLDDRSELALGVVAAAVCWSILLAIWDRIVTLAPGSEAIVASGLTGAVAVAAGLGVYLLSLENQRGWRPNGIGKDDRPMVVTLIVVGVGVVGLLAQIEDLRVVPWLAVVVCAVALGLALLYRNMKNVPGRRRRPVLWVVFVVYLASGTTVALVRTGAAPKLEPIAILLNDPIEEIAGFYVGESDGEIHIAQLAKGHRDAAVSAEAVDAVVSVSRKRVTRKAMRAPAGLDEEGSGRQQAERLLRNLIAVRDGLRGHEVPATPVPTLAPEKTFAPRLSLHSAEPIAPTSADDFLRNSQLHWAFRNCAPKSKRLSDKLSTARLWRDLGKGGVRQNAGCGNDDEYSTSEFTRPYDKKRTFAGRADLAGREGFYLDLDDSSRTPALKARREGRQLVLEPVPVYFERHDEVGDDGIVNVRITYWFFYPYSSPTGKAGRALRIGHEGDWERISVLTHRAGDGLWLPLSVRFHEHNTSIDVPWERVDKAADETGLLTHPQAYVAKGSHATYSRPDEHPQILKLAGREILEVNDQTNVCPRCPLWYTWRPSQKNGKPVEMLIDAEKQPWYGFGGAWGVVGNASDFTGPLGPSTRKTRQGRSPSPQTVLQPAPAVQPAVPPPADK